MEKHWIHFIVIAFCLVLTQTIACLAGSLFEGGIYILNILAIYTIIVQWVVYLHAGGFFGNERTEKYYDLTGSLTFITTLALSLYVFKGQITMRHKILSSLVAVWSVRLGLFLFLRIHNNNGIDSRFSVIKESKSRFLMSWTLQGTWVFIMLLPVLILNQNSVVQNFGLLDNIGILFWVVGFLFEVIADYQKSDFRKISANKDKFISSGLWSISRHPNYFGEILLWFGLALSAFGGLGSSPQAIVVFLSPVFVTLLLIFVSGIPSLEQKANLLFGDRKEFKKYKAEVPVLVPFIGRKGSANF